MGLDARVGEHYFMRMGSYSSIQDQRRQLIELVIKYCTIKDAQLKETKEKAKLARKQTSQKQEEEQVLQRDENTMDESSDEEFDEIDWHQIIGALKTWTAGIYHAMIALSYASLCQINYSNVGQTKNDLLAEVGLLGLKWFVDHSDCDGYWTPGQSMDILHLFKELQAHGLISDSLNDEGNPYFELLEASIAHKTPVTFC